MHKQIIYPNFIARVFAMTCDLVVISIVLVPIINICENYLLLLTFQDFFLSQHIDTSDQNAIMLAVKTPEFSSQITSSTFIMYFGALFILNTFFMGLYFVTFWRKFGTTPGKLIMRMKIVDANDYSRPSLYNCVKRFCGYITALIGIWSIIFTKKGRALHDKIANTVVIKA